MRAMRSAIRDNRQRIRGSHPRLLGSQLTLIKLRFTRLQPKQPGVLAMRDLEISIPPGTLAANNDQ